MWYVIMVIYPASPKSSEQFIFMVNFMLPCISTALPPKIFSKKKMAAHLEDQEGIGACKNPACVCVRFAEHTQTPIKITQTQLTNILFTGVVLFDNSCKLQFVNPDFPL